MTITCDLGYTTLYLVARVGRLPGPELSCEDEGKGPYRGAISKKLMRAPESQRLAKTEDSTKKAIVVLRLDLTQGRGTRIPEETRTPAAEQNA